MEIIFSTILTILLTLISVLFTIKHSSKYKIKPNGKGREKYVVSEKIAHKNRDGYVDSARIVLEKSSFNHAMGFMDISLTTHPETIFIDRYSFIHSCIHSMYAPGKTIINKNKKWTEKAPSNLFENFLIKSKQFDLNLNKLSSFSIHKKIKKKIIKAKCVKSYFSFPDNYTGPRYKERTIILVKGIGIVFSKTEYVNKDIDTYVLRKYKVSKGSDYWLPINKIGNYWVYDIFYDYGPNKLNINE